MPDYDGNTVATARNIGTLTATTQTFSDWVGSTDTNDYYRFTTTGTSNLRLNLTGMTADADVMVYAANGITVIGISAAGGSANETVNINNLAAGTYYVRVYPYGGSTYYNLSLAALRVDNAGNTVATARNIGTLTATTQTFSDAVGSTDTNDYYRFSTTATSNFRLNLTGMSADADVEVYSANGTTVVGGGTASGNANETVNINNLAAGIYYVRVYPYGGSTNYSLFLAALPVAPTDNAGNTVTTARNIGTLTSTTQTFSDAVGTVDTNDYYRFSTTGTSNLRLNLTGMSSDADVVVYGSNGTTVMGGGTASGNANETVSIDNLAAGTYYVNVHPFSGSTNYNLSLAALPVSGPTDNAGNTVATARNIGTLTATTQTFSNAVGSTDTNDYYRFSTTATSNFRLNLTGMSADADVEVYSANGTTVVGSGGVSGNTNETVNINNLAAGTYYVRVYPYNGSTNYNLSLAALPVSGPTDNAGNTVATARNIGTLTATTQTFSDAVSTTDTDDYYRFTTTGTSNLRLNLTGMSADADVVVYGANGTTVMGRGENGGSSSETVNINNLAAGTYYARVYPGVTGAQTNYNVALSAQSSPYVSRPGIDASIAQVSQITVPAAVADRIDNLVSNTKWGDVIGTGLRLTYSFINTATSVLSDTGYAPIVNLNAEQQQAAVACMNLVSNVCGITFAQVNDNATGAGDIRWGVSNNQTNVATAEAYYPSTRAIGGDIWIGTSNRDYSDPDPGEYGYATFIHELGHALGLEHPHEGNPVPVAGEDQLRFSVMSYRDYHGDGLDGYGSGYFPTSYMLNDVAALQYLYGANSSYRTGNDVYSWSATSPVNESIWDAGGIDTISASNQATACIVNLNSGQWSSVGVAFNNSLEDVRNYLGITYGTVIENATGSSYNDTLVGNSVANILVGGAGNDTLTGGAGNDTLTGGAGNDNFKFVITTNGVDTITDFASGSDRIQIVGPNFGLASGATVTLRSGTTLPTSSGTMAQFLYNSTTGGLSFDRDGSGSVAAVQIATLTNRPTLTSSNFQVVAA